MYRSENKTIFGGESINYFMKNYCILSFTKIHWVIVFITIFTFNCNAQLIKAYFNHNVDNSVSSITDAIYSTHLEDSIVELLNSSQSTVEIAVWDNGSQSIVSAINACFDRGVAVRYISSSNATNSALGNLNNGIPVLMRNSGLTSNVMHNKFIIIDEQTILSGSMNLGMGSMEDDYNNIVIIKDVNLANNYLLEFNEMWGGTSGSPNTSLSRFGPDKIDNTTYTFTIGGSLVELYFSPSDQTTMNIISAINEADETLDVAMFTFINNDLGDAVIAAKNRGVSVRAIIENVNYFGSEYNGLVSAGISTYSHQNVSYDFHHKYAVVDANTPSSNPTVITGSHNWTNSAENEYDENTLIIHDPIIAGQYAEEFQQRINDLTLNGLNESLKDQLQLQVDLNNQRLWLSSYSQNLKSATLIDLSGAVCNDFNLSSKLDYIDISQLSHGSYILRVNCEGDGITNFRFVK